MRGGLNVLAADIDIDIEKDGLKIAYERMVKEDEGWYALSCRLNCSCRYMNLVNFHDEHSEHRTVLGLESRVRYHP